MLIYFSLDNFTFQSEFHSIQGSFNLYEECFMESSIVIALDIDFDLLFIEISVGSFFVIFEQRISWKKINGINQIVNGTIFLSMGKLLAGMTPCI